MEEAKEKKKIEMEKKLPRRLEGKVAIVTASTQGIGFGITERFGLEGASVVVSSRKQVSPSLTFIFRIWIKTMKLKNRFLVMGSLYLCFIRFLFVPRIVDNSGFDLLQMQLYNNHCEVYDRNFQRF